MESFYLRGFSMNKYQLEKELRKLRKSLAEVNNRISSQQRFAGNENLGMLEDLKKEINRKITNFENQLVIKV